MEFILFFGDGESEDEEVRERVSAGRRVGEGVGSVVADEAEVVLCGFGRRERCGKLRSLPAVTASFMSSVCCELRLTLT